MTPSQPCCSNCRVALPSGASFCHNCGVDIPGAQQPEDDRKLCSGCLQPFHAVVMKKHEGQLLCPACVEDAGARARPKELAEQEEWKRSTRRLVLHAERQNERFEVPGSFVKLQKKGLLTNIFHGQAQDMGKLVDLSRGGGQCLTRGDFKVGDRLALDLRVPAFEAPICISGVVVWTSREGKGQQRLGVRFDPLSGPALAALSTLETDADPA
jgi:hypothetical protein